MVQSERNDTRQWWEPFDTRIFGTESVVTVAVGDVAAICAGCGDTVRHVDLEAAPAILDDWSDTGDEAWCPECSEAGKGAG